MLLHRYNLGRLMGAHGYRTRALADLDTAFEPHGRKPARPRRVTASAPDPATRAPGPSAFARALSVRTPGPPASARAPDPTASARAPTARAPDPSTHTPAPTAPTPVPPARDP
ncbi:hypothetical protein GCM10010327_03870 [Streptomyces nitrosporeus]|nr:hypothetical protein GCM10010327_03870 [Streptomyces nitrosporeus]